MTNKSIHRFPFFLKIIRKLKLLRLYLPTLMEFTVESGCRPAQLFVQLNTDDGTPWGAD